MASHGGKMEDIINSKYSSKELPSLSLPLPLAVWKHLKSCIYINPNFKMSPLRQVFKPRTPPEAIALCSRLLEYTPVTRLSPLEACAHAFFDELRQPNTRLPSGRELPLLFNFSPVGQFTSVSFCIPLYLLHVWPLMTFTQCHCSHSMYVSLKLVYLVSPLRAVYPAPVELHTHSSSRSCTDIACLTWYVTQNEALLDDVFFIDGPYCIWVLFVQLFMFSMAFFFPFFKIIFQFYFIFFILWRDSRNELYVQNTVQILKKALMENTGAKHNIVSKSFK